MRKPFAIFDTSRRRFILFFENMKQAVKYHEKRLGESRRYVIIDKRRKK